MRKIKFRGWHIAKKTMFSAETMVEDQLTLLPTGNFINVSGQSTKLSIVFPRDKFIPLQYTGFKDKDGKEAYFGDLEKFITGIFEICWGTIKGRIFLHSLDDKGTSCFMDGEMIPKGKIIGNIYENPELLKKKDEK